MQTTAVNLAKMVTSSQKELENTVGKGEIARNEQFFLFPKCFQKHCIAVTYKHGFVWKRVNNKQPRLLMTLGLKTFENKGKGENV